MTARIATLAGLLLGLASIVSAQSPPPLQLQTQVKPAFRIVPMVHRFEAPRGKLLNFEFQVESLDRPTSLRIRPVGLRQQENGVIMPDEEAPGADAVRMLTPSEVDLDPTESFTIRGRIQLPRSKSAFHSFGILVKDLGRPVGDGPNREPGKPRVAIKFVTQYLLRCDVSVLGVANDDVRRLQITSGELADAGGYPQARVWIANPTDSFLEFGVRCRVTLPESQARQRPFSLVLPVRENAPGPERYVARILPHSRVRLGELVPDAVLPGAYQLDVELHSRGRFQSKAQFPVVVGDDDFPAQREAVLPLASHVSVEPAKIELSLRRRGQRFLALTFTNHRNEDVEIRTSAGSGDDSLGEFVQVRPAAFTLPAHSSRKALVLLGTPPDLAANRYGKLNVHIDLPDGDQQARTIPVAVLARVEDEPKLSVGAARWDDRSPRPALVVPVSNEGSVHLPLSAKLTVANNRGQAMELTTGFGRWLLPGQSGELTFEPPAPLPAGTYRWRIEIHIGKGRDSITVEDTLRVESVPRTARADGA